MTHDLSHRTCQQGPETSGTACHTRTRTPHHGVHCGDLQSGAHPLQMSEHVGTLMKIVYSFAKVRKALPFQSSLDCVICSNCRCFRKHEKHRKTKTTVTATETGPFSTRGAHRPISAVKKPKIKIGTSSAAPPSRPSKLTEMRKE